MRVFVDSNIMLDYLLKRDPFHGHARKLMLLGYVKEVELWLSSSQMTDLFYILTGGGKASLAQDAKGALTKLRTFIRISSFNEVDFDEILRSDWQDLEDCCVHHGALKVKAEYIVTRDKRGFEKSSITVVTAEELFLRLGTSRNIDYEEVFLEAAGK